MDNSFFCSQLSRAANEQLAGSATHATIWFLLEYSGRWEPDAFPASDISPPVRQRLQAALEAHPDSRLQLIRQPGRTAAGITFFVALSCEAYATLYAFNLNSYEDLLALDLEAITGQNPAYESFRHYEPLFLICTHARRDRCCALYGQPVYEAAARHAGAAVWQTTHVGGHRFAANLVAFPHGIYHGRVTPETVPQVIDSTRDQRLFLDTYRGRSCYNRAAQAAEYFLRRETGIGGVEAIRLWSSDKTGPERWTVTFMSTSGGETYRLELGEERREPGIYQSCGDTQPAALVEFRLLGYETGGLLT